VRVVPLIPCYVPVTYWIRIAHVQCTKIIRRTCVSYLKNNYTMRIANVNNYIYLTPKITGYRVYFGGAGCYCFDSMLRYFFNGIEVDFTVGLERRNSLEPWISYFFAFSPYMKRTRNCLAIRTHWIPSWSHFSYMPFAEIGIWSKWYSR